MNKDILIKEAEQMGFKAAVMNVDDLTIVPQYRKYCEDNLCGNYDLLDACPPKSGTLEEMTAEMMRYKHALILQTSLKPADMNNSREHKEAKHKHNILTEQLMGKMHEEGIEDILMMGAGPWKNHSCMSAYCVDAQKMADVVGMECWADDGKSRYFSLLLY